MGCDGVFDVLSSADAIARVRGSLRKGAPLDDAAQNLVRHAIDDRDSRDNVSVVIVKLELRPPGAPDDLDAADDADALLADLGLGASPRASPPAAGRRSRPDAAGVGLALSANRPNARPPPARPAAGGGPKSGSVLNDDDLMDYLLNDDNFS